MLDTFKAFIADEQAFDMFITGEAGTGKTTGLSDLLMYCKENDISTVVCAHTHKACGIIRSKVPEGTVVKTTHSFLKKRPGVNDQATLKEHISISTKLGMPEEVPMILFIDEYSQVGEKDYMDLGLIQDPDYEGKPRMKIVYIGDPNQLPPVGDQPAIRPTGKYQVMLKLIYRQKEGNGLLEPLSQLVRFINGEEPEKLIENENFIRGVNLEKEYLKCKTEDKVLLAYTNERVELLNALIKGRPDVAVGDDLFSPTLKEFYTYEEKIQLTGVDSISLPFGEDLYLKSRYKTLEHLFTIHDHFALITDPEGYEEVYAVEFGHYQYRQMLDHYGQIAIDINKEIEKEFGMGGKTFANNNKHHPLARKRAKAWRDYLTYRECVVCIDFPFAMTVHKSQGSTFDTVFVDTENLGLCAHRDYTTYLKLMYVAISRASNKVYTN